MRDEVYYYMQFLISFKLCFFVQSACTDHLMQAKTTLFLFFYECPSKAIGPVAEAEGER